METKIERLHRQAKQYRKFKRDLKKSVLEMYGRKVKIDASRLFNYEDVVVN